jgi:hypothetical protein
MKLTVTQVVLGLLAAAACFYIQTQIQTSLIWLWQDSLGNWQGYEENAGAILIAAHWMAVLTGGLGLATTVLGLIRLLKRQNPASNGPRKLIETGLIGAAAMVIASFLVIAWGFPTSFSRVMPDGRIATQFWLEPPHRAVAQSLAALVFISSLAIFVCGLEGYLKMRRKIAGGAPAVKTLQGTLL